MLMTKGTHESIVNALIRERPNNDHLAGETTLLCHGTMGICKGNLFEAESGMRIVKSIFRRNNISANKATIFINRIKSATKSDVAAYLKTLKPYVETSRWLNTEISDGSQEKIS